MTDLRKAAQMALDWRDKNSELLFELGGWDFIFEINDWSQSIRGALAQPEEPDWAAAGFSKPPVRSEQWWRHEVSNAWAEGYEKGRASVKQREQEPVAWADKYDLDREGHDFWVSRQANVRTGVPLYTAPPQREWQGLTDEEANELTYASIAEIEAKLKEKNHDKP